MSGGKAIMIPQRQIRCFVLAVFLTLLLGFLYRRNKGKVSFKIIEQDKTIIEQTSDTGGWCPNATRTKHLGFDRSLMKTLAHFLKDKTVGSFGDGPGKYKQAILDTGLVKVYDAYDGAPFCETTSNGLVHFLDLSIPQYGISVYDWILCLEVAEHIPKQFEAIFLDNVIRHAKTGVILSWARPGQHGYSHVNNREPEYVMKCLNTLGFELDIKGTNMLRNGSHHDNLKRNINVYLRQSTNSLNDLVCNA